MDTMHALEKAELAARDLMPYLVWQLSPESPGYHPTFRSAVAAFEGAFAPEVFAPGSSRFDKWHEDRRIENGEPYGYVYRLRYSPDHWSHQLMFSEAANFTLLPAEDVKEVTRLYAGPPPEVETALRYANAAIHSLLDQIGQMRGMFKDEDGAIQRAVDDGDAAIEDIGKALARLA